MLAVLTSIVRSDLFVVTNLKRAEDCRYVHVLKVSLQPEKNNRKLVFIMEQFPRNCLETKCFSIKKNFRRTF